MTAMSDAVQFLETEAALNQLLTELQSLKSAADQITAAGEAAALLTDTSEQVVDSAAGVLNNSARILAALESARLLQHLQEFTAGLNVQSETIKNNHGQSLDHFARLTDIIESSSQKADALQSQVEELRKRSDYLAAGLKRSLSATQINRILLIFGIFINLLILLLVTVPLIRPLFIR